MNASYDLKDRVAIITGGARGIGRAAAEELAGNGARIAIWDIDLDCAEETAAALGGADRAAAFACDQAEWHSVQAAAAATVDRFGRTDILVNNAGITGPNATLADYPADSWAEVIAVNLVGVFHCCKALVPQLVDNGWGRIVNVASVAGKEGNPNASAYSAAKAGVIALTKSLGKELVGTGVLVNCITPAAVKTGLFDQMSEEHIAYMLSKIPMGRFGTVEENAALIAWLCSPQCTFSTAGVFDISGGRSTY
jgi:NAD(P)-dependent dehydrogenase (short-subunit alcohol dehydrogenase family)